MPQPMMIPRIDPVLDRADGGASVTVTGPAGQWDDNNVVAAFTAVVSQVNADGTRKPSIVTAMGWVKYAKEDYPPGADPKWTVTAKVTDGARLQASGAEASAWVLYVLKDGSSWVYEWRLPVVLV